MPSSNESSSRSGSRSGQNSNPELSEQELRELVKQAMGIVQANQQDRPTPRPKTRDEEILSRLD